MPFKKKKNSKNDGLIYEKSMKNCRNVLNIIEHSD